ncbi:hypothetical protein GCM10009821_21820 [Aeromicrobium halocynthiae]|uniref:Uncharacterized protein n=1 Tax=Aeromicrobium halocynthiae TaxID=560557 RepID=A0ABN2W5C7_9ACTN
MHATTRWRDVTSAQGAVDVSSARDAAAGSSSTTLPGESCAQTPDVAVGAAPTVRQPSGDAPATRPASRSVSAALPPVSRRAASGVAAPPRHPQRGLTATTGQSASMRTRWEVEPSTSLPTGERRR